MTIKNFLIKTFPFKNFPKEKNGLLPQKGGEGAEETSFIVGKTSGRVLTAKDMATIEVKKDFPNRDKSKVEVRYRVIKRGGREIGAIIKVKMRDKETWYPLYTHTQKKRGEAEKTFNERLPKEIKAALDAFEGVQLKDNEIRQKVQEIEELDKTIHKNHPKGQKG